MISEIRKICERIRENPNANIDDLEAQFAQRFQEALKREKENILCTWFLRLYDYDYGAIQRDLCKCLSLNPDVKVTEEDRINLLKAQWQSCQNLFPDFDYTVLFNEVARGVAYDKSLADWDENSPFV